MLEHAHPHAPPQSADPSGPEAHASPREQQRRLALVLVLTLGVAVLEAAGGAASGSLALLADAGHMVTDGSAVALSLAAVWLVRRRTSPARTYGFRRAEILAAFLNALALVVLALWIVSEAVGRLYAPPPVRAGMMFWIAGVGLAVNVAGFAALYRLAPANLGIRAALWHITGDLFGSLATLAAAVVIHLTGWAPIDAVLSLAIAGLIGLSGGKILLDSANLLLDSVPKQIDGAAVGRFLESFPEVRQICDLHIWGISSRETMLTAHLVVDPACDRDELLRRILDALAGRFRLAHMTLQLETTPQSTCRPEW
jgi:cobalt-zinc-cadmium efflux system protein